MNAEATTPAEDATPSAPAPWPVRLVRYVGTSAIVGIIATLVDWGVLVVVVWAGMSERWAVVPAFLAGAALQFVGNRRYTFGQRGPADRDLLRRQVVRFIMVEFWTLVLNAVIYNVLREPSLLNVDYRVSRVVAGLVVYLGFSIPLWRWVFSTRRG